MAGLIQIVDDHDKPVGSATKQEAWDKGLIHRVVRIMLVGPDGRLLLQHRDPGKDLYPDCWDNSVAGHVDAGEDYKTAAHREIQEEIGLEDIPLTKAGRYYVDRTWQGLKLKRFCTIYTGRITELPTELEAGKVDDVRWFTVDEVKALVHDHPDQVTDGLQEVIERYY